MINYVLFVAIIAWTVAQVSKAGLYAMKFRTFEAERLFGAGGMPSSHSALVCSALIAVSRKSGIASTDFAIMSLMAFIVMYDAMGVRRAAGLHAREINKMNRLFDDINDPPESIEGRAERKNGNDKKTELQEFLGHTPLEVLGGALLGILIALIIPVS